jgi:hypothetical protein
MSGTDPPRRLKKVPEELGRDMAVLAEAGETATDIAKLFNLNPRTVRKQIALVSEDEKRAIRQYLAAQLLAKHHQLAIKAYDALMTRDFNRVNKKTGRFETSEVQLATLLGISTDKIPALSPSAGMADPQDGGSNANPLFDWMATEERIERGLSGLKKGTKVTLKREVSLEAQDSSDSPPSVPADWSEE